MMFQLNNPRLQLVLACLILVTGVVMSKRSESSTDFRCYMCGGGPDSDCAKSDPSSNWMKVACPSKVCTKTTLAVGDPTAEILRECESGSSRPDLEAKCTKEIIEDSSCVTFKDRAQFDEFNRTKLDCLMKMNSGGGQTLSSLHTSNPDGNFPFEVCWCYTDLCIPRNKIIKRQLPHDNEAENEDSASSILLGNWLFVILATSTAFYNYNGAGNLFRV